MNKKLEAALAAVKKSSGDATAYRLTEGSLHSEVEEVIPTGIDAIDHYGIQCGGLPCGRVSEIWSEPHKGKTALGLSFLASCQRHGGVAVLIETEEALTEERIETFKVDKDELIIFNPDHVEQGFGQISTFLEKCPPDLGPFLFVWDSLAASQTLEEFNEGADGKPSQPGTMARAMSQRLKRIIPVLQAHRAHLMFINQPRQRIGVMFGNPETTGGGSALKFYASLRMRIGSGGQGSNIADSARGGEQVGHAVTIKFHKNKMGFPFREVTTRLMYEEGWDNDWTTVRLAKSLGVVPSNTPYNAAGAATATQALDAVGWSPAEAAKLKAAQGKGKGKGSKKKAS